MDEIRINTRDENGVVQPIDAKTAAAVGELLKAAAKHVATPPTRLPLRGEDVRRLPETIVVAGFGRCGSSLVMRMLCRAGLPIAADDRVACEFAPAGVEVRGAAWFDACRGRVVKVLDPQRKDWPADAVVRWVWIDRDPTQQAKSVAKFLRATCGMRLNMASIPRLARSIVSDRPAAMATISRVGGPVLCLRFEDLIERTTETVAELLTFVRADASDAARVSAERFDRSTDCLPHLAELQQIEADVTL